MTEREKCKKSGRVYTPDFIVRNVLDMSGYYGVNIVRKNVIDNSCGDGAFLCEIVDRYCIQAIRDGRNPDALKKELENYIHGIDVDEAECDKCIENLNTVALKYGVKGVLWDIKNTDALSYNEFDGRMDFVLGNPPYVRVHNLEGSFDEAKSFSFAKSGMTDLYIVFYEIGIKMLNSRGVLGYITPSSFFTSVAGEYMRNVFVRENLLDKVIDMKHFRAFDATTYSAIVVLDKKKKYCTEYYEFDNDSHIPQFVDTLLVSDYFIDGKFFFSEKTKLQTLKMIFTQEKDCSVAVKNGYATLCDEVYITDYQSKFTIPVIKASRGETRNMIYPYDKNGNAFSEEQLIQDGKVYGQLLKNKSRLAKRNNDKAAQQCWYAYGRSQAIGDTYKNKVAMNAMIRTTDDLKLVDAPSGTGVYGGLYLVAEPDILKAAKKALEDTDFQEYVSLLGKYKSGGYYTFSSKDVKTYLDYKIAKQ